MHEPIELDEPSQLESGETPDSHDHRWIGERHVAEVCYLLFSLCIAALLFGATGNQPMCIVVASICSIQAVVTSLFHRHIRRLHPIVGWTVTGLFAGGLLASYVIIVRNSVLGDHPESIVIAFFHVFWSAILLALK